MKDLPRVFANPIDRDISNNRTLSYGKLIEERKKQDLNLVKNKIEQIFKSEGNIYSIDCIITFENDEEKYTIIGKTEHNLVTKTQKLIPIKEIYDIELAK